MALKAQLANFFHIAGVGIWALGMDGNDPAMLAALLGNAPVAKDALTGPPPGSGLPDRSPPSPAPPTWPSTRSTLRRRAARPADRLPRRHRDHRPGAGLSVDRAAGAGVVVHHAARGLRGDGRDPDRLRGGRCGRSRYRRRPRRPTHHDGCPGASTTTTSPASTTDHDDHDGRRPPPRPRRPARPRRPQRPRRLAALTRTGRRRRSDASSGHAQAATSLCNAPGGVAQLVERYVRNVEVDGSSPFTSTIRSVGSPGASTRPARCATRRAPGPVSTPSEGRGLHGTSSNPIELGRDPHAQAIHETRRNHILEVLAELFVTD